MAAGATAKQQAAREAVTTPVTKQTANPLNVLVRLPVDIAKSLSPNREASMAAKLAFYGTIGLCVVLEVIEPPLAILVAAGHALASSKSKLGKAVGEGIEDAAP